MRKKIPDPSPLGWSRTSGEKDVWEFQAKSGSSGSCRLFLHFLWKIAVQEMSGKTPRSPRHPSSRHPRSSEGPGWPPKIQEIAKKYQIVTFGPPKGPFPDLLFLAFFGKRQGKAPKKQGFFVLAEPLKSLRKKGKTHKKTRNSLERKKARKSKNARKRRSGFRTKNSTAPESVVLCYRRSFSHSIAFSYFFFP